MATPTIFEYRRQKHDGKECYGKQNGVILNYLEHKKEEVGKYISDNPWSSLSLLRFDSVRMISTKYTRLQKVSN